MAEFVGQGVLRVVPAARLEAALKAANEEKAAAQNAAQQPVMSNLANHIRTQFDMMKRHRNQPIAGWSDRLLRAQRVFNGVYEPTQLAEIRKFGGSEVYARIIAMKCRGASSLLRDVYLAPDRPWGLDPTPDPDIPPEIMQSISQLVNTELSSLQQAGQPTDPTAIRDRMAQIT